MIKQYVHSGFSSSLPSEGTMFWPRIHVQKKPTDRSKQHSVVFLYLSCWKFHHWFSIPEPWRPWQISWTKKETQISSATSASKLDPCIRKKSDQNSIEVNIHFLNVGTGLAEVVGRKGKQWWVKPTLSWTYDRNRNQGKGSTMKQYLVVEVCRRGIDAASFSSALKQNMMYIMYIYIYPATTIFKTHTNHHSWCQLDTKRKDPYFLAGHPLFRPTLPKDTSDNDTS